MGTALGRGRRVGVRACVTGLVSAAALACCTATASAASAVTSVSIKANTSSAQAQEVVYTATFTATHALASGEGYVQLKVPSGAVLVVNATSYAFTDGSHSSLPSAISVNPGGAGENVVDLYVPGGFAVAAGDKVEVQAFGVKNPSAANSSATASVSTSSDTQPVSVSLPIAAASAVTEMTATSNTASAQATRVVYTASFKATSPLSAGNPDWFGEDAGYIQLTAPAGANFASGLIAVIDGSHAGDASAVSVDPGGAGENVVDVSAPFAIAAGDKVEVVAYGVENPTAANASAKITLSTSSDATAATKAYAILAPTAIGSLSSKREASSYTEQFVAHSATTAGDPYSFDEQPGFIKFVAPSGASLPSEANDYEVTIGGATTSVSAVHVSANTAVVELRGAIGAGQAVTLKVNDLSHPPGGEVHVSTSSDATAVAATTTGGEGTPSVTDVTPHSGAPSGGTTVKISGVSLGEATSVKFGGKAASSFKINSPTSITAISPEGTGTVDVVVESSEGTSATSVADRFSYLSGAPQFGRCAKVGKGEGPYANSGCDKEKAGGDYVFTPGAARAKVTLSAGASKLELATKTKLECTAASGTGEYDSSRELDSVVLTFTGCESDGAACSSEGAASGEVKTSALEASLGFEEEAKRKVGLDFFPAGHNGTVLAAQCGSVSWSVRGSVIAPIKSDKAATSTTLKLKQSKASRNPNTSKAKQPTCSKSR